MEFYLPLLNGAWVTLKLAAISISFASLIAFAAGYGLMSRSRTLRTLVRMYVEFFRGTSLVVQLFWLFFVLPEMGVVLDPFLIGVAALALNSGAYGAEAVRGAVQAVPSGQVDAAIALNMGPVTRAYRIIMPQALVRLLPPATNLMIEALKATSVVSFITISDLTLVSYQLNASSYRTFEIFSIVLLLYFLMAQIIVRSMRLAERKAEKSMGL